MGSGSRERAAPFFTSSIRFADRPSAFRFPLTVGSALQALKEGAFEFQKTVKNWKSPPSAATYGQRKRSNGHVHFFPFSVLTVTFAPLERQTIVPHSSVR